MPLLVFRDTEGAPSRPLIRLPARLRWGVKRTASIKKHTLKQVHARRRDIHSGKTHSDQCVHMWSTGGVEVSFAAMSAQRGVEGITIVTN